LAQFGSASFDTLRSGFFPLLHDAESSTRGDSITAELRRPEMRDVIFGVAGDVICDITYDVTCF
jgi:hypothetical protein